MEGTDDSALKQGECGFNRVGVYIALYVDFVPVADGFVLSALDASRNECRNVGGEFVGNDSLSVRRNMFFDWFGKVFRGVVLDVDEPQIAAALPDAHDHFLALVFSPVVTLLPADVGFVNFHHAPEFRRIRFHHCLADAMREIPCRAVLDTQSASELISGDALLGFANQGNGEKPLG